MYTTKEYIYAEGQLQDVTDDYEAKVDDIYPRLITYTSADHRFFQIVYMPLFLDPNKVLFLYIACTCIALLIIRSTKSEQSALFVNNMSIKRY